MRRSGVRLQDGGTACSSQAPTGRRLPTCAGTWIRGGTLSVKLDMSVNRGMIVGEHTRPQDLDVNLLKSNRRRSGFASGCSTRMCAAAQHARNPWDADCPRVGKETFRVAAHSLAGTSSVSTVSFVRGRSDLHDERIVTYGSRVHALSMNRSVIELSPKKAARRPDCATAPNTNGSQRHKTRFSMT